MGGNQSRLFKKIFKNDYRAAYRWGSYGRFLQGYWRVDLLTYELTDYFHYNWYLTEVRNGN